MRTPRSKLLTPAELVARNRRLNEALKLRRRDPGVDPVLLLAAVVWPEDPILAGQAA